MPEGRAAPNATFLWRVMSLRNTQRARRRNWCAESPRRKPYEPLLHLSSCSRYRIESNDPSACSRYSYSCCNKIPIASPPEKTPGRLRRSHARERVSVGWQRRSSSAASAVDHRPHESLTSDLKSRRRWPTADWAKRLLNNCTPRRRSISSRRRSPQCEICSPYRAVRMNTRAKFGWRV
jgi:hypothetical protein